MNLSRHVPNILTLGNLLCGCLGILYSQDLPLLFPAYFVWIACVFDFFDGFAARALKTTSSIGKELDSLADMVSFGILPAMTMFAWMSHVDPDSLLKYSAFMIAAFSALRLAKFNIDERQTDHFIGLPTPANALFITSLVFLDAPFNLVTTTMPALVAVTLVFSALLVAPIDLFALKFKNFTWAQNKIRFTFTGVAVLLLVLLKAASIPLIILLYIIFSLVVGLLFKK